jgi:3-hydroxy-D-aspartate aldolase
VDVIGKGAAAADRCLGVYIEIDVGLGRGGFRGDDPGFVETVDMVEAHPHLTLRGIQAYEGHAVLEPEPNRRRTLALDAHAEGQAFRDRVSDRVGRRLILSGGGTGTAAVVAAAQSLDELQCGSYVLMDAAYADLRLPSCPHSSVLPASSPRTPTGESFWMRE